MKISKELKELFKKHNLKIIKTSTLKKKKDVKVLVNFNNPRIEIGPEYLNSQDYQIICTLTKVCIFSLDKESIFETLSSYEKALNLSSNKKIINIARIKSNELYNAMNEG